MLKKLFSYFKKTPPVQENYSISISLNPELDVKIELLYPDLTKIELGDIPHSAERCAELILYLNSAIFRNKLMDIVNEKAYKNTDLKEKLFFDNLIAFHDLLKTEIQKANSASAPVVRPISAFNLK